MSDQPLTQVNEHSARANTLIENWNMVHKAINCITALTHSMDYDEYGITAHEKSHEIEGLKKILKRINDGLATEIPAPVNKLEQEK